MADHLATAYRLRGGSERWSSGLVGDILQLHYFGEQDPQSGAIVEADAVTAAGESVVTVSSLRLQTASGSVAAGIAATSSASASVFGSPVIPAAGSAATASQAAIVATRTATASTGVGVVTATSAAMMSAGVGVAVGQSAAQAVAATLRASMATASTGGSMSGSPPVVRVLASIPLSPAQGVASASAIAAAIASSEIVVSAGLCSAFAQAENAGRRVIEAPSFWREVGLHRAQWSKPSTPESWTPAPVDYIGWSEVRPVNRSLLGGQRRLIVWKR